MATGVARQGVSYALLIVRSVVLARLLTAEQFGVAGVALILVNQLAVMADFGFGATLIKSKDLTRKTLNTYYLSISTIYFVLCVGLIALYPVLPFAFLDDCPHDLVAISVTTLLLRVPASIPAAVLMSRLQFARFNGILLMGQILTTGLGVLLASLGAGYYSLVVPDAISALCMLIACHVAARYRPGWEFSWKALKKNLRYTLWTNVNSWLVTFTQALPMILITPVLGTAKYGLYYFAFNRAERLFQPLMSSFRTTVFPVLSHAEDKWEAFASTVLRVHFKYLFYGIILMAGGLLVFADQMVPDVFGSEWVDSVPVFKGAAVAMAVICLSSLFGPLHRSKGSIATMAVASLVRIAVFYVALDYVLPYQDLFYCSLAYAGAQLSYLLIIGAPVVLSNKVTMMQWWQGVRPTVVILFPTIVGAGFVVYKYQRSVSGLYVWLFAMVYVVLSLTLLWCIDPQMRYVAKSQYRKLRKSS